MDDIERPPFGPFDLEQIEVDLHKVDTDFWKIFAEMRELTPANRKVFAELYAGAPLPPKRPYEFIAYLWRYADCLFYAEASKYPKPNARLLQWLSHLAVRVEARVITRIKEIDAADAVRTLEHHEVSEATMSSEIRKCLAQSAKKWLSGNEASAVEAKIAVATPHTEQSAANPSDLGRARKVFIEPLLLAKGWSILDWANEAEVSHATAMDYLQGKTRPYRSTRVKLAKALEISPANLPR